MGLLLTVDRKRAVGVTLPPVLYMIAYPASRSLAPF